MGFSEGKKGNAPLPQKQAEALYNEIAGDLGIRPTTPRRRRRHYFKETGRYLLPRLLAVLAVAALFFALLQEVRIFETGVTIENLAGEAIEDDTVARVHFSVQGGFIKEITAQLGEELLEVEKADDVYYVDCRQDGTLLITVRSWNGARDVKSVRIAGLAP